MQGAGLLSFIASTAMLFTCRIVYVLYERPVLTRVDWL
jgi:hypothetical protein